MDVDTRLANYEKACVQMRPPNAKSFASVPPDICRARILVAITFHYNQARLTYLADVVLELLAYPIDLCVVEIYTNTSDPRELRMIDGALSGLNVDVRTVADLDDPLRLTWAHKPTIVKRFLDPKESFDFFIYLEDDERLTFASFCYFLSSLEFLQPLGLIPSFARIEWSDSLQTRVTTDHYNIIPLREQPYVDFGEVIFVELKNTYWGGFVLTKELAREYVNTRSFTERGSFEVVQWQTRERAAMGLIFENAPAPFSSRYVVPVMRNSNQILPAALLAHLPNNYANDLASGWGSIPLASLLEGEVGESRLDALAVVSP